MYDTSTSSAQYFTAVTPADGSDLAGGQPRGIYVGGAGNVAVHDAGRLAVTFVAVPAGSFLSISPLRVLSTGTTATNIVAVY